MEQLVDKFASCNLDSKGKEMYSEGLVEECKEAEQFRKHANLDKEESFYEHIKEFHRWYKKRYE